MCNDKSKLDYERFIKEKWKENAGDVPKLLVKNDANIVQQVETYSHRFDEPTDKIKKKILDDSMFANCFAKDPTKQTTHEKLAFEYLKKHDNILNNFCKMPQSGENAIYLSSDGVFTKEKKIGKALDFCWNHEDKVFFASHKYTKNSGGAQDNAFNEQKEFLRKFKNNEKENQYLFVICDGTYYTKEKIKILKDLTSKRSFVVSIEEVVSVVNFIIK
jgi:hypothetical protein